MLLRCILLFLCGLSFSCLADENEKAVVNPAADGWSAAFAGIGIGPDFGAGIMLSTPSYTSWDIAFSFSGNLVENSITDARYAEYLLGVNFRQGIAGDLRIYERVNAGLVVPDGQISSRNALTVMPTFGVEYFLNRVPGSIHHFLGLQKSFYGELGVARLFLNRSADAIFGRPVYASGTVTSIGLRFYF